jgi:pimeloyl-ACP methyl ester carboxylesterase
MPEHRASPVLTVRTVSSPRHTSRYLEAGPADGPLMLFLHGWPGIGLMWRTQLEAFAADGWHCVAPDMRGYGGSSVPDRTDDYRMEELVTDMVELHEHLGAEPAVWVGHDWGSIVVGAIAAHEPARTRGIVLVSWAYFPESNALSNLVPLVDRNVYPIDQFPDGQWDYYRYYTTHFDAAVADLDADVAASLASVFRAGDPRAVGTVAPSAATTDHGGRFGAAHRAPAVEPDASIWPAGDFETLVAAFGVHGFRGPCAWYLNDDANIAYAATSRGRGRLAMPVLFVNGEYDLICGIEGNAQGDPMRRSCSDLTIVSLPAGHWLPQERGEELVAAIRGWTDAW